VLVFTRRRGEAIVIGDGIEIVVLSTGREGVRVGVRAPASVPVHRKEIYEQICAENRQAAGALLPAADAPQAPSHAPGVKKAGGGGRS
jgi:carbon storage regulator